MPKGVEHTDEIVLLREMVSATIFDAERR